MTARSRLLAGLSAAISLVALTGCSKPTPIVSVVSGGTTAHTEATLYCFSGQTIAMKDCRTDTTHGPTVIKVKPGQPIGIDVSRELVTAGWVVVLPAGGQGQGQAGQDQSSGKQVTHYLSFVPQFSQQSPQVAIDVRMLDHGSESRPTIGLWQFVLVPA
ncbi:MAG: hypothetical protein NVSMB55_03050 [Mycobacteriales bacterium]